MFICGWVKNHLKPIPLSGVEEHSFATYFDVYPSHVLDFLDFCRLDIDSRPLDSHAGSTTVDAGRTCLQSQSTKWVAKEVQGTILETTRCFRDLYLVGFGMILISLFPSIGFLIIPTDFHMFQRCGSTTKQFLLPPFFLNGHRMSTGA